MESAFRPDPALRTVEERNNTVAMVNKVVPLQGTGVKEAGGVPGLRCAPPRASMCSPYRAKAGNAEG
jgi:hypothetical protein